VPGVVDLKASPEANGLQRRPAAVEPNRAPEKKKDRELEREAPAIATTSPALTPAPTGKELSPNRVELAPAPPSPLPTVSSTLLEDPSLRVVLLPTVARINVETQDNGSLSLQVKVRDGVADVRATGPAAAMVEARQGDLRVALAGEGLALGHFDLTQSDSGSRQQQRFEAPADREPGPRRAAPRPVTTSSLPHPTDGHLSVKA